VKAFPSLPIPHYTLNTPRYEDSPHTGAYLSRLSNPCRDDREYPRDYGRGGPSRMAFQSAPRQRTAIACRCRCSNCERFNQECIFTTVSFQAQAHSPRFPQYSLVVLKSLISHHASLSTATATATERLIEWKQPRYILSPASS